MANASLAIQAPKTILGTAKRLGHPVRWNREGQLPALVYPSGQVIPFALKSEMETELSASKGWKEEMTTLKHSLHVKRQEVEKVVARNVHNTVKGIMRSVRK